MSGGLDRFASAAGDRRDAGVDLLSLLRKELRRGRGAGLAVHFLALQFFVEAGLLVVGNARRGVSAGGRNRAVRNSEVLGLTVSSSVGENEDRWGEEARRELQLVLSAVIGLHAEHRSVVAINLKRAQSGYGAICAPNDVINRLTLCAVAGIHIRCGDDELTAGGLHRREQRDLGVTGLLPFALLRLSYAVQHQRQ